MLIFCCVVWAQACTVSADNTGQTKRNLALGKPYTYSPAATYQLTKSPSDAYKLTDGKHASGHFWTSPETVGWQESGPIRIEVDLENPAAIDEICLTTARGSDADVSFPERADVFISVADKKYGYYGNMLSGKDHDDGPYAVRRFCSKVSSVRGRKVLLAVKPKGSFTFIDEIEVFGAWDGKVASTPDQTVNINEVDAFLADLSDLEVERRALVILGKDVLNTLSKNSELWKRTASLLSRMEQHGDVLSRNALDDLRSKLFAVRQKYLADLTKDSLIIWTSNPWTQFSPLQFPQLGQNALSRSLDFDLPGGGVASGAVAFANPGKQPITVAVSYQHGPSESSPLLEMREVVPVVRSDYRTVGDALVNMREGKITINPGESRQIWLTVRSDDAPPAVYPGKLMIAGRDLRKELPLSIKIWPSRLARQLTVYSNAWSYLTWRPIKSIPGIAVADLADHHVNTIVVHPDQLPWPKATYREFDKVVSYHKDAKMFLFYLAFNDPGRRALGMKEPFMSPAWQAEFRRWVSAWAAHLKMIGISTDRYAFYPMDEPQNDKDIDALYDTARLIKQIDPALQVFTTVGSFRGINNSNIKRLQEVVDIFQVGLDEVSQRNVSTLLAAGKKVWSYGAVDKRADPHQFFRLQAWLAFKYGLSGIGFWAYADTGPSGTAWNDFDGVRPDFSVIYEGNNSIVASKRWEAWREGAEDYELLLMAGKKLKPGAESDEFAKKLDMVLKHPYDYGRFEEVHRYILETASR